MEVPHEFMQRVSGRRKKNIFLYSMEIKYLPDNLPGHFRSYSLLPMLRQSVGKTEEADNRKNTGALKA